MEVILMKLALLFSNTKNKNALYIGMIILGFVPLLIIFSPILLIMMLFSSIQPGGGIQDIFTLNKHQIIQELNIENNIKTSLIRGVYFFQDTAEENPSNSIAKEFIEQYFIKTEEEKQVFKTKEEVLEMIKIAPFSYPEEMVQILVDIVYFYGDGLLWPVPESTKVNSLFGERDDPTGVSGSFHYGLDIGATGGLAVVAAIEGEVIFAGWDKYFGNYIKVKNADKEYIYAHNEELYVSKGEVIQRGQKIAKTGSTGNSTGEHLHFEVREKKKSIDPIPLFYD